MNSSIRSTFHKVTVCINKNSSAIRSDLVLDLKLKKSTIQNAQSKNFGSKPLYTHMHNISENVLNNRHFTTYPKHFNGRLFPNINKNWSYKCLNTAAISYSEKSSKLSKTSGGEFVEKFDQNDISNYKVNINEDTLNLNKFGKTEEEQIVSIRQVLENMTINQRREILLDLQLEESADRKKEAEEKLASWHWRSKFGRPTSIHPPQVDPSGTYCAIPQDWLMKKVAESSKPQPPTFTDLRKIAVFNALPFVGFGFLDNFIMIVAGDYIDLNIGTYLSISTMAAAALGNTISDLAGIGSAWYVEFLSSKIGVHPPDLSQEQQNMASSRWSANIGRGVGVCLGCILGMFPLLFLPNHSRVDRMKKAEESKL